MIKHSGIGISSFVLSLVSIFFMLLAFIVAIAGMGNKGVLSIAGLFIFFTWIINSVGIVLGIVDCCLKERKKALSITGIAINGSVFIVMFLIIIIGLMSK